MKYELRDYQKEASCKAIEGLLEYRKPFIVQMATGAGKSLIIADVCHKIDEPILILQPSKEILEQNYNKLKSYGVDDIAIYSASMGTKDIGKYTYATIGSIYKKSELFKHFKYVIIDECHSVDPKNLNGMYTTFLRAIKCTRVLGLTATPYRIVNKYVTINSEMYYTATLKMINRITKEPFFKKIAYQIETQELIDQGYLCPIDYFAGKVDISGLVINSTGADFTEESIRRFWNKDRLQGIARAVQYSDKHHKRTLVFCSSIKQAEEAKQLVTALGFVSEVVTGKTPKKDRERIIESFRRGEIKHLFNVGVFTVGFDMPILDCIVLARPTMSLALFYQIVGRGVRLDPKNARKKLHVYDLVGVVNRMGRVETIRVKKEAGGFRDEVWSERGRMDEKALFQYFIKDTTKGLHQ